MEEKTKQRLIGVLVLVGALFVILPFLFHNSRPSINTKSASNTVTTPSVSLPLAPANAANTTGSANTTEDNNENNTETAQVAAPTGVNSAVTVASTTPAPAANQAVSTSTSTSTTPAPASVNANPNQNQNPVSVPAVNTASATPAAAPVTTVAMTAPSTAVVATQPSATVAQQPATTAAGAPTPSMLGSAQAVTTGKKNPQFQAANNASVNAQAVPTDANPAQPTTMPSVAQAKQTAPAVHHAQDTAFRAKPVVHPIAEKHRTQARESKGFSVQLAVFSDKKNAEELMAKLRHHHFQAYSRTVMHNQRTLTAVFVGPEMNAQKAENIKQALQRDFRLNGVVRKTV